MSVKLATKQTQQPALKKERGEAKRPASYSVLGYNRYEIDCA